MAARDHHDNSLVAILARTDTDLQSQNLEERIIKTKGKGARGVIEHLKRTCIVALNITTRISPLVYDCIKSLKGEPCVTDCRSNQRSTPYQMS